MELGTGVAVAGLGLAVTGTFAIIMRFLSASKDRENGNGYGPPSDYATRDDIRNIERRLDEYLSEISGKLEGRMQEIRDQLKSREERCMGRAERIASIEKAQQENEKKVDAVCRRSDVQKAEERGSGVVGFVKREEDKDRMEDELFKTYSPGG